MMFPTRWAASSIEIYCVAIDLHIALLERGCVSFVLETSFVIFTHSLPLGELLISQCVVNLQILISSLVTLTSDYLVRRRYMSTIDEELGDSNDLI